MIQKPPQLKRLGLLTLRETVMILVLAALLYFSGLWNPRGSAWKHTRKLWFTYFGNQEIEQASTPVYWYLDDRGVKHFVTSLGKVPAKFRPSVRDENSLPVITRKDFVLPEQDTSPVAKVTDALSKKNIGKSVKEAGKSLPSSETAKDALEAAQTGLDNFKNFVGKE